MQYAGNLAPEGLQLSLRDVVRVSSAAGELTGDMEQAICWFRNEPIVTSQRQTAAELFAGGHANAEMSHHSELVDGVNG